MSPASDAPAVLGTKKRAVLFLRWVVIIVTSYLLLFGPGAAAPSVWVLSLVALLLASNLLLGLVPDALFERTAFQGALVATDTLLIGSGMILLGEASGDLFLLYFSVLFLAALGESLAMIMGGCVLVAAVYLFVLLRTLPPGALLTPAVLLRFPFLFAVATFYGYLVEVVKSERRRAEEAVAHEKFRTDFLATLTHDLQSPLSAIAGFSRLLQEAPDQAPARQYRRVFDAIRRGAEECSELVTSFLALVRGEARPGHVRRQVVDLSSVAEEVFQLHENAAAARNLRVRLELAPDLPALSGDRMQIRRAVSNLVGNAIKFVHAGGEIRVATALDGTAALLRVSDDGPGIPEELQSQIFEQYARGDGPASGTGLGLFIVRLVAEAHGGSVTLDSRPGQGSRFTLRIPLPADTRIPAAQPAPAERVRGIAPAVFAGEDRA